ncbi:MAG: VCBS repeat-containing protein [Planctomycetota bacterium]
MRIRCLGWSGRLVVCGLLASVAGAQIQLEPLSKRAVPHRVAPSESLAVGDLDSDGRPDLVFGDSWRTAPNDIYRNRGRGAFAAAAAAWLPAPAEDTEGVALADFDGDGDLDLVVANYVQSTRLYFNDGTGAMTDVTAARLPGVVIRVRSVLAFDFDGDADIDLLFGHGYGSPELHENDGTGRFEPNPTALPAIGPGYTWAMAAFDAEGDGDVDVVLAQGLDAVASDPQNRLLVNDGTGAFTDATAARMPVDAVDSADVVVVDVDDDGDPDLVFANRIDSAAATVPNALYLNDGSGQFVDATASHLPLDAARSAGVAAGDVDGDGDPDLVFGNFAEPDVVYLNDGAGRYADASAAWMPTEWLNTSAVALVDVDADADLDLVAALGTGDLPGPSSIEVGRNRVYLNDGSTLVETAGELVGQEARVPATAAVADFDGDGALDLVAAARRRLELLSWRGDRGRRFAAPVSNPIPSASQFWTPGELETGDFDGDGDLDVMAAGGALLFNDGAGGFVDVTATHWPGSLGGGTVEVGDVDGDGDVDAVFSRSSAFDLLITNDGTGRFRSVQGAFAPTLGQTTAVDLGDVDGDGDLDVVFSDQEQVFPYFQPGALRLLLNDGAGAFSPAPALLPVAARSWSVSEAVFADIDDDGDLDLVVSGPRLLRNDGTGVFTDVSATQMPPPFHVPLFFPTRLTIKPADLDGDGDLDLVVKAGPNRILENDGRGGFREVAVAGAWGTAAATATFAIGDFDGDRDEDVLEVHGVAPGFTLFSNLTQQLTAVDVGRLGGNYRLTLRAAEGQGAIVFFDVGTLPAPIATPFGTLQLDLVRGIETPILPLTSAPLDLDVFLPPLASAAGLTLYSQAAVLRPAGIVLTNLVGDRLLP